MTYWKLSNIPVKATNKQLRLPQAINHIPPKSQLGFFFVFNFGTFFWCTFCVCFLCNLQPDFFFINALSHTMSRNSYWILMSMATDLFGGLFYTTYGLVIANCYSKACVCKNNYITSNRALQVLWYSPILAIILLSVISNDQTILNVLIYWCNSSPHTP